MTSMNFTDNMIALADAKNFYATCEGLFNPKLRGVPVVVLSNNDGCIVARSAEAKALGIKMGAVYFQIKDFLKEKGVIALSSNYPLYGDISQRVMEVLSQFAPEMEIYSIDEAFLNLAGIPNLDEYTQSIRKTVLRWTGVPVGIGVAPTKTLAKVANHIAKKRDGYNGVCILATPEVWNPLLHSFDIADVWGIGRKYSEFLFSHGVKTAGQFSQLPDAWLKKEMTIVGLKTAMELRGQPCIELELEADPKKGITVSRCFGRRITEYEELKEAMLSYVARAGEKLRAEKLLAKHMLIFLHTSPHAKDKIKDPYYSNRVAWRLPFHTNFTPELSHYAAEALASIYKSGYRYMKCGIILSDLVLEGASSADLFDKRDIDRNSNLMQAVDRLNSKHGIRTIFYGGSGVQRKWVGTSSSCSPSYTTNWDNLIRVSAQ